MEQQVVREQHSTHTDENQLNIPSYSARKKRRGGGAPVFNQGAIGTWNRRSLWLPLLLASVTGVLLGVCLLILFKGQANEPVVTNIPAPSDAVKQAQAAAVKGKAATPGVTLWVWQLGLFQEKGPAETEQKTLESKGLTVTLRGAGPYQLIGGVAPDKKAGATLEAALKQAGVSYFAKEWKIAPQEGYLHGLSDADAQAAAKSLEGALQLGNEARQAVVAGADAKGLAEKLTAVGGELAKAQAALDKAERPTDAAQFAQVQKHLQAAVAAVPKGGLEAQGKLAAFYATYEQATAQLIQNQ